ncbi:FMN phosphatase YigB (HAD superfamily) [Breznakia sp. PF5-3]|uniref:HAD family hydrolase n=1 Tax=unclassified Breznakia TaxID=2623764 RepID=UPI0024066B27|nr:MULTISPECIES: HAD family hydrolase [unclassified Breznakia]MDL2276682.1 HAD family hydrolase [Breznakia sp. OttesenSCG-928-G09]MDF9823940.1 FMN phosphatase YigB (HAD superfamily) [Breznakia sp. PM6-1]MDF9834739.1 FMN phosphatase YigB (HAD superfamily) [Breznakia sp. PF5-3]MDF9836825.1 FMN phosphatase YigB (HAD superfamily) [Breznakia sp. PFB2-8]MDF9858843.1 FMN phosphatase YigB (HAD superfamily) [Breznakia sp. PH5-24]
MNTILFDLDGTLLSMDLEEFIEKYFGLIAKRFKDSEYDEKLLVKAIYAGTSAMQKNNGSKTNAEVFWNTFEQISNIPMQKIEGDFEDFYHHDFQLIEKTVTVNQDIVEAINILKQKGYRLICATNPLFPKIASESRLRWSGVDTSAFEYVTTFEDFHFCKPNPAYFEEVMEKYNIDKKTCIMVGNDAIEDGAIQKLDVPLYLINDHLINSNNAEITATWCDNATAFLQLVKTFDDVKK